MRDIRDRKTYMYFCQDERIERWLARLTGRIDRRHRRIPLGLASRAVARNFPF